LDNIELQALSHTVTGAGLLQQGEGYRLCHIRLQARACSSRERAPAASATSVTLARDHRPAHLTSTGFSDRHAYAYAQ